MTIPSSIYLSGSEAVQNAAGEFSRAVDSFARTQQWMDEAQQRFIRDFTEQVDRLVALTETGTT